MDQPRWPNSTPLRKRVKESLGETGGLAVAPEVELGVELGV